MVASLATSRLLSEFRNHGFQKVGKEVWFGQLDTSMFKMIDGDLAISGQRIDKAPKEIFSQAMSLARERHHAATWLLGDNPIYSEIDTST